jgi:hypothetical protein
MWCMGIIGLGPDADETNISTVSGLEHGSLIWKTQIAFVV